MQDKSKKLVSKIHVIEDEEFSRGWKGNKKGPNKDNNNKSSKKAKTVC